ncbi:MAG TPA: hypothetical protein VFV02_09605 [Acidimicrobiales bacterium]|nr:hypothetical protein [Acidimicrobiales bacterium]
MAVTYPAPSAAQRGRAWWQELAVALAPAALALLLATAVWLLGWRGVDQAAQLYRVTLFKTHGFLLWDSGWYGGNFPLSYSVIFPAIASVVSIQATAIVAAAVATWAFDRVIRGYFGSRPLGTWYFAVSTILPVMIGQLPFLAGEAAGLSALLALQRGHRRVALGLGVLAALFSPLAAAFLAMACVAWAVKASGKRGWAVATAAASLGVIFAVGALFPGDGPFPFPWQGLVVTELLCLTALTPFVRTTPAVRLGAFLYAAASLFSFVVPNPLGGNAPRLAGAIGVPLLACFLTAQGPSLERLSGSTIAERLLGGRVFEIPSRWRIVGLAVIVPFIVWQWAPSQKIVTSQSTEPATTVAFYQPLLHELSQVAPGAVRLEIPPTLEHWESAYVAPYVSLARGWERQLDVADNSLFYTRGALTVASYTDWLNNDGVDYVALPAAPLDYAAKGEGRLLASGHVGVLNLVWQTAQWRLWKVDGSPGLVTGDATLTSLSPDHFSITATAPGLITVRVRYTAFWSIASGAGCVGPAPDGWTSVDAYQAGPIQLSAVLGSASKTTCPQISSS